MGCFGGGSSNTQTTVQKADPWSAQQPYLKDIFEQAQALYNVGQPSFYPGQTFVGPQGADIAGQQSAIKAAYGPQMALGAQSAGANEFLLGDVLRADSNPYMAGYAQGAIRPVMQELTRTALPSIAGGAVAAGQYGGSRQGIAEGLAISDATQQALDTTSKMYSDAYGQNLDALTRGLALTPQTMQASLMPSTTLSGVGQQQRAFEQAAIDEAMRRQTFEQTMPWDTLAAYQGLIQGNYGGTGTSSITGGGPSGAQNLLGAVGTGLSTYSMLSSPAMTAAMPALGVAAPWIAGGLGILSLFD